MRKSDRLPYEKRVTRNGKQYSYFDCGKDENGKETKDPAQWHDEIEFTFQNTTVVAETGIIRSVYPAGTSSSTFTRQELRHITNSAGVPYNPPLEKEWAIRVLRITKHSRNTGATLADPYINAVNSDAFVINKPIYGFRYPVAPTCAKIKNYSTAFGFENGFKFWKEVIEVHINPNGWRRRIPDIGYHRRMAYGAPPDKHDNGENVTFNEANAAGFVPYTAILCEGGHPITTPIPLNGNGQPKRQSDPHVYWFWSVEEELPFSGIRW